MKMVKSLFFGSAVAMMALAGAQAAPSTACAPCPYLQTGNSLAYVQFVVAHRMLAAPDGGTDMVTTDRLSLIPRFVDPHHVAEIVYFDKVAWRDAPRVLDSAKTPAPHVFDYNAKTRQHK